MAQRFDTVTTRTLADHRLKVNGKTTVPVTAVTDEENNGQSRCRFGINRAAVERNGRQGGRADRGEVGLWLANRRHGAIDEELAGPTGVADALREPTAVPLPEVYRSDRARRSVVARAAIGESGLAETRTAGRASTEEAVAELIGSPPN